MEARVIENCNDNGTKPDWTDDYFVVDVIVWYQNPPGSGLLYVTGPLLYDTLEVKVSEMTPDSFIFQGIHMHTIVPYQNQNNSISLTAWFNADPDCAMTNSNAGVWKDHSGELHYDIKAQGICSVCVGQVIGQPYPSCHPDESPDPTDPCEDFLNYVPDPLHPEYTPLQYLRVVVHIFQKEDPDDPGNFTPDHLDVIRSWFNDPDGVNGMIGNMPDDTTDFSPHVPDTRIRFLNYGIEGYDVFFHKDNKGWGMGYYCGEIPTHFNYTSLYERYVQNPDSTAMPANYYEALKNNPDVRNALHLFVAGVAWHDTEPKNVIDSTDCLFYCPGGYSNSHQSCFSTSSLPATVIHGTWYSYLEQFSPGAYCEGAWPGSNAALGRSISGEIFHLLGLDHPSPLQAHWVHEVGTDGCDDTPEYNGTHNLLGCNYGNRYALTECQTGRMLYQLARLKPFVLRYPDSDSTFNSEGNCVIVDDDIVINDGEDVTWLGKRELRTNVIVRSGGKLTIRCDLGMPGDARILVEPNGELYIEGARIYNNCSGDMWQGIIVQGTPNQHQYKLFGVRYQGFVSLQNASIEGAEVAVRLFDPVDPLGTSGGVIVASNSSFLNNLSAIQFTTYHNFNPLIGNKPSGNLSQFTECTFEIDDDFQGDLNFFRTHVSLRNVEGIFFTACQFYNNTSVADLGARGDGLRAFQAGFTVQAKCTSNQLPCQNYQRGAFRGFDTGVRVNLGSVSPFRISRTDFSGNGRGIFGFKSDLAYVVLNNFEVGSTYSYSDASPVIGIQLSSSTGYKVEENTLKPLPSGLPANATTIGVLLQSSGPQPNEQYKNSFEGLDFASLANGQNRNSDPTTFEGLQYLCNDNSAGNLEYDFAVPEENWNPNAGIAGYQGYQQQAAGNTFTPLPALPQSHFLNEGAPLTYFYFVNMPTNFSMNTIVVQPSPKGNNCSSKLPGKEDNLGEDEKQQYQSEVLGGGPANEKSFAANMLVRDYLVDTSAIYYDSARLWLATKGYLYDHFLIVDSWLRQQQPDSAQSALASIPQLLTLEGQEQLEYTYFDSLKSLQIAAQQQELSEQQMADANEHTLVGIANAGEFYAAAQAQNLLNEYKGYSFQPAVILPASGQQELKLPEGVQFQSENLLFEVVPNPSRGAFNINYILDNDAQVARAILSDISGKRLKVVKLEGSAGTVQVPATSLSTGIYFLSLNIDGKNLKRIKVILSR